MHVVSNYPYYLKCCTGYSHDIQGALYSFFAISVILAIFLFNPFGI